MLGYAIPGTFSRLRPVFESSRTFQILGSGNVEPRKCCVWLGKQAAAAGAAERGGQARTAIGSGQVSDQAPQPRRLCRGCAASVRIRLCHSQRMMTRIRSSAIAEGKSRPSRLTARTLGPLCPSQLHCQHSVRLGGNCSGPERPGVAIVPEGALPPLWHPQSVGGHCIKVWRVVGL